MTTDHGHVRTASEPLARCTECGRSKKPIGRDSMDNGLCWQDCHGHAMPPHPGYDWPDPDAVRRAPPRG